MSRGLLILSVALSLAGCATSKPRLDPGRGLYWTWGADQLAREGFPGYRDEYSSVQWGVLHDDEGIAYGPKSYYEGSTRLDHPHLTVDEHFLESRWIRLHRSACCTEPLLGHFLEIADLAYVDLSRKLGYASPVKLSVHSSLDVEGWRRESGRDYWVTHLVDGSTLLLGPIDVLFRRTLASHAAFGAVAMSLLDLKTHGRIPPWLREGLSSYLAEEGFELLNFMTEFRSQRAVLMTPAEVERHVYPLVDRENGRIARYNAFLMVWHLSETWGWNRVRDLLDGVERGERFDAAVERVYGLDVEAWLAALDPTVNGEPTTTLPARTK